MDILKSLSSGWKFNGTDFVKTLRTAFLVGICMAGIGIAQYVQGQDMGIADKMIDTLCISVVDGIRRWVRDNSIPLPEPNAKTDAK